MWWYHDFIHDVCEEFRTLKQTAETAGNDSWEEILVEERARRSVSLETNQRLVVRRGELDESSGVVPDEEDAVLTLALENDFERFL